MRMVLAITNVHKGKHRNFVGLAWVPADVPDEVVPFEMIDVGDMNVDGLQRLLDAAPADHLPKPDGSPVGS